MKTQSVFDDCDLHPQVLDWLEEVDEDLQHATLLVWLCNSGADGQLRKRYAKQWWSEFLPERVTLAALISSDLSQFVSELSGRLQGSFGQSNQQGGEAQRSVLLKLIGLGEPDQRRILATLEQQASVCCTFVRADQDAKRKEQKNG